MKSCGLIVEYNPFHFGHLYHLQQSKEASGADCMIAVMSGNFLQRGEPAIIDKWHRTEIALSQGVDVVLELPYVFAVQNSDLFAKGSVLTLSEIGVDTICFGSEQGDISPFLKAYEHVNAHETSYKESLHQYLDQGFSFPEASRHAYEAIGLSNHAIDLSQPNNILGYSYTKTILDHDLSITPMTIKRTQSGYHDETITHQIASATSIRKSILEGKEMTKEAEGSLPGSSIEKLMEYKQKATGWHDWERYFPLLQYKLTTLSPEEIRSFHGVEEGLEHRLLHTIKEATNFSEWMTLLKTKRYTWTRLQRTITHILTHTKKQEIEPILQLNQLPYVRLLGMSETGRSYIRQQKKKMGVPILPNVQSGNHEFVTIEERSVDAYLSCLPAEQKKRLRKRELGPPVMPHM
ncbi:MULTISPECIES: nucleotidyltransferase [Pontibacillus]|uniref:tRNA(Met) cytidine acetate ligase n=1 Tax=Pontibacillus chungwhensis TaxID=265426 RepID=A0ABY8V281_9BACI|nr:MULTISPECIES: nucleotidyltransferase [Pontibacillus]MCD5322574.1 nucleotidyltransferase [Pontibacillus sp. HN14]WIF99859.1 nucleotidyltransferase [Pontibacillus chungwhensis]